jgi:hypothetical protein
MQSSFRMPLVNTSFLKSRADENRFKPAAAQMPFLSGPESFAPKKPSAHLESECDNDVRAWARSLELPLLGRCRAGEYAQS